MQRGAISVLNFIEYVFLSTKQCKKKLHPELTFKAIKRREKENVEARLQNIVDIKTCLPSFEIRISDSMNWHSFRIALYAPVQRKAIIGLRFLKGTDYTEILFETSPSINLWLSS